VTGGEEEGKGGPEKETSAPEMEQAPPNSQFGGGACGACGACHYQWLESELESNRITGKTSR